MAHCRHLSHPLWVPVHYDVSGNTGLSALFPTSEKKPKNLQATAPLLLMMSKTRNVWCRKEQRSTFFNCCLKPRLWEALESFPARLKDKGVTQTWMQSAGWLTGVKTWASVRVYSPSGQQVPALCRYACQPLASLRFYLFFFTYCILLNSEFKTG